MTPTVKITGRSSWAHVRERLGQIRSKMKFGVMDPEIAEIAAAQEYGTSTIPARSFINSTVRENRKEIARRLGVISKQAMSGEQDLGALQRDLGEWVVDRIRHKILDSDIPPPLAPSTVKRKGFDKPLIYTGAMLDAISWGLVG